MTAVAPISFHAAPDAGCPGAPARFRRPSPLINPAEMANPSAAAVVAKLEQFGDRTRLAAAVGVPLTGAPGQPSALDEALFAIGRFEAEDPSFHPYSSRYDQWLEGRVALTEDELRGLRVFEDPSKGNRAACHLDRPEPDGLPPVFTDWQYEGLGVPRNPRIPANDDPRHFDLGLCGPIRTDLAGSPQWCGMFRTPSLRDVAVRAAYFHNGIYHTLEEVLRPPCPESRACLSIRSRPGARLRRSAVVAGAQRRQDGCAVHAPARRVPAMSLQDMKDVVVKS